MHISKKDMTETMKTPEATISGADLGDFHVGFETFHHKVDTTSLFFGLPDNRCQCPHWGYVIKGRMVVNYPEGEEIINEGDAYYMAPGHIPVIDPGTEIVEFSPKDLYRKTIEAVMENYKK